MDSRSVTTSQLVVTPVVTPVVTRKSPRIQPNRDIVTTVTTLSRFPLGAKHPFFGEGPPAGSDVFFIGRLYEMPNFGGDARLVVTTSKISRKSGVFLSPLASPLASPPPVFPLPVVTEEYDPWTH